MNGEITRDELSTKLDQELLYNTDTVDRAIADIEIKGRTLVNLLGRSGNGIYQQKDKMGCSANTTIGFDGEHITLTNNEATVAGKILAFTAFSGKAKVGSYYLFACEKSAGTIGQVAFYGCTLLDYSWNKSNVCYGLYKFNGVDSTGASHIDMIIGEMQPSETARIKNVRLYEISESEAQSIINKGVGVSTPLEIVKKYPYVDDVKCVVNPYMESKENLLEGAVLGWYSNDGTGNISGDGMQKEWGHYGNGDWIPVEPSTTYTLHNPFNRQAVIIFRGKDGAENTSSGWMGWGENITVSSAESSDAVQVLFANLSDDEVSNFRTSVTLVKGSIPKTYDECNNSRIMFETKLYDGETLSKSSDGTYIKNSWWEEADISNIVQNVGSIGVEKRDGAHAVFWGQPKEIPTITLSNAHFLRYDGKIIPSDVVWGDSIEGMSAGGINMGIIIPDTLTGWGDSYTPTLEEVRAFFLGWKLYCVETKEAYNGTGTKRWAKLWCGVGVKDTNPFLTNVVTNSGVNTLPIVMNDQGYTPYKLIYKKATPTVEEVKTYGGLVVKEGVDVNVSSGLVLNEYNQGNVVGEEVHSNRGIITKNTTNLKFRLYRAIGAAKHGERIRFKNFNHSVEAMITAGLNWICYPSTKFIGVSVDYLIYRPDTITSYDYTLNTNNNVLASIAKNVDELSMTKEELAKTKKELELTKNELAQRSNPNLLTNGGFQVWQRGTSFVKLGSVYTADRWKLGNADISVTKSSKGMDVVYDRASGLDSYVVQWVEVDPEFVKGKTFTVSAKINGVVYKHTERLSDTLWQIQSTNTPVGKLYFQNAIQNSQNACICCGIYLTSLVSFNIEWIKLELGEYATPFVPRSYGEELALCQRYYRRITGPTRRNSLYSNTNKVTHFYYEFSPMRVAPTPQLVGTLNSTSGIYVATCNGGTIQTGFTFSFSSISTDSIRVNATHTTFTSLDDYVLVFPSGYLELDAEIY